MNVGFPPASADKPDRFRGAVLLAVVAALILTVSVPVLGAQEKTSFNWAFVKRGADGSPIPLDFKERVNISQGDLFKIHVQPLDHAYIYLLLQDTQGDLQRLFPESFDEFARASYLTTRYFIPEGENWFTLDNAKGTERFHLLASRDRLAKLETLVRSFEKAGAAGKAAAREAVLDEIARLRKEHSQLTIAAEKPVTVAGGTRGINTAVQKVATRIDAAGFYYKLFRLEH